MAENQNNIDSLFRNKLGSHSEMPSPHARERLEACLANKGSMFWAKKLRFAGFILTAICSTGLVWFALQSTEQNPPTIAHEQPVQGTFRNKAVAPKPLTQPAEKMPKDQTSRKVSLPPKVAVNHMDLPREEMPGKANEKAKYSGQAVDLDKRGVPPLEDLRALASPKKVELKEAKIVYKVTIVSNGLLKRPEKDNLVNELGNKIDEVGVFLSKVDEGFADFQDAKNGFFTNLSRKKEISNN